MEKGDMFPALDERPEQLYYTYPDTGMISRQAEKWIQVGLAKYRDRQNAGSQPGEY
jgi:hypothetical protein